MTMAIDVHSLAADLDAEQHALCSVVTALTEEQWQLLTPSPGWTVADQIGHLTYFDRAATAAIEAPDEFARLRDELFAAALDRPGAADELTLGPFRTMAPPELHEAWRDGRRRLSSAAATLTDGMRVEWYGPSMSAKSFLTARLMECWAHGQDVVDTAQQAGVDVHREATDRLRHIAQLGVITRGWSYTNRGMEVPAGEVRVELTAPSGAAWTWGPEDAEDTVRGPVEDFCLVVTQRRHPHDTDLEVTGDVAADWLVHAQAFAGGPTDGPVPTNR